MRIVHIVLGKANPNRMNGVNKIVHKLATTQVGQGHDVTVVGLTNSIGVDDLARSYHLKIFSRKTFYLDAELGCFLKSLEGSALCHIHGGFILDFYWIARALKSHSVPYIITSHGCYNKPALVKNYYRKRIFFWLFDRAILNGARKVVFSGPLEYHDIDELISGIKKVIIHNGQDLLDLQYRMRELEKPTRPVFGFVGRLDSYHKGLDKLLEGFYKYRRGGGNGALWLVGDGPDMANLKAYARRNNLTSSIKFWGSQFGEEKLNLIGNMDVFVHTSRFEGFPMSVLEAAGVGKPLLLSKGTNFGEHLSRYDCGILMKRNTPDDIDEALQFFESLWSTGKFEYYSANAKKMVLECFNWETISDQLIYGC